MKIPSRLVLVLLLCFLAPTLHFSTRVGFAVGLYEVIGFHNYQTTATTVLGCLPEDRMFPVVFVALQVATLAVIGTGFWLSNRGKKEGSTIKLLGGALLFYPAIGYVIRQASHLFRSNPLWFEAQKASFSARPVPLFGTFFGFKWASLAIETVLSLLYLYWAYRIVFQHWNRSIRGYFALGSLACAAGLLLWVHGIGPLLFTR